MEKYMSASEAAEKWGVIKRRVTRYCADGRIEGAIRFANVWQIPADAKKPCDPRKFGVGNRQNFGTLPRKCPELIFTTLYNEPGSGDGTAEALSFDGEARLLFLAQLAYFRGETDRAIGLAEELLAKTLRNDVKIGCAFVICVCSMYKGNDAKWINARKTIENIPCNTKEDKAVRDFELGHIDSALYDKSSFPEWFAEGDFSPIPLDSYPFARFVYLKWLMLSRGDPAISTVCGPIISQSQAEGALLSEIYCRIITAIGFHDRGDYSRATQHLDRAIALALPDKLYSPFAEYRNELGILLDERLSVMDKNAAKRVREMNKQLTEGWTVLCRRIRGIKLTTELTQREKQAAKLVAQGLSNVEIAKLMCLSHNTVKRYVSEAMAKYCVSNRAELKAVYLNENETKLQS